MMQGTSNEQLNGMVGTITKNVTWRMLFFASAICVVVAAFVAFVYLITEHGLAVFTFVSVLFLFFFGLMMLGLDAPLPQNNHVDLFRTRIYKYLLFMTRFTGRGLWYAFLGTEVWVVLWDCHSANDDPAGWLRWLAVPLGLVPVLVGIASALYGFMLSRRLNSVRKKIMDTPPPPQCNERGFSKQAFSELLVTYDQKFTDDELDYVINGLSFSAKNDGVVSQEEYYRWISAGWGQIV